MIGEASMRARLVVEQRVQRRAREAVGHGCEGTLGAAEHEQVVMDEPDRGHGRGGFPRSTTGHDIGLVAMARVVLRTVSAPAFDQ